MDNAINILDAAFRISPSGNIPLKKAQVGMAQSQRFPHKASNLIRRKKFWKEIASQKSASTGKENVHGQKKGEKGF